MSRKYYVEVPVRCVQTYLVEADSAAAAKRLVDAGEGEAVGWETYHEGRAARAVVAAGPAPDAQEVR